MKWEYEKACIEAGMEEEKIREMRRFFDRAKKRLKYENNQIKALKLERTLFFEVEENDLSDTVFFENQIVDGEEEAIKAYEISKLKDSLNILSAEEKHLIIRYYYEDMSLRNIAKELGIALSTVQNRHKRILEKLRKEMGVTIDE